MKNVTKETISEFFRLGESQADQQRAEQIISCLERCEFKHDDVVCRIGDKADGMYFVESGKLGVFDKNNQPVNELASGKYFGEYAVVTGECRLTTVRSKGDSVLYRLNNERVMEVFASNPRFLGSLMDRLYAQLSDKHAKILELAAHRRGLARDPRNTKRMSARGFLINYGIVLLIFVLCGFLLPSAQQLTPIQMFIPVAFLVGYIAIAKRTLESLSLSLLLVGLMLQKGGMIGSFYSRLTATMAAPGTVNTMLMLALMGAFSRLLASSGGISALRGTVLKWIKTKSGTLSASIWSMIILFVDEYLSLLVVGICFMPLADEKKVSREMSSFLLGTVPSAVSSLAPLSIWGVFLIGLVSTATGGDGTAAFVRSLPFNFAALLTMLFAFMAAFGRLPLIGTLKTAQKRIDAGGAVWPEGSEQYFTERDDDMQGSVSNLLLPILVLIFAAIACGTIEKGSFSVNIGYGLVITLLFMFMLYTFRQLMTPEGFFDNFVAGAESMLVPIILLVMTVAFSTGVAELGFASWLGTSVPAIIGDKQWLLPMALFAVFTAMSALLGSSWSMYVLAMPIAIQLATAVNGSLPLYIGVVCAGGITGCELSMYHSGTYLVASVAGCEPMAYYTSKLPYGIVITVLSCIGYLAVGWWMA